MSGRGGGERPWECLADTDLCTASHDPPPESTCAVYYQQQVIQLQGCSSVEPVRLAFCQGNCGDTTSMYVSPTAGQLDAVQDALGLVWAVEGGTGRRGQQGSSRGRRPRALSCLQSCSSVY